MRLFDRILGKISPQIKDNPDSIQQIKARDITNSVLIQLIEQDHSARPIVDERIKDELEIIRKSRFFNEFDAINSSLILAKSVKEGELSSGSNTIKSHALAWCARILASKELAKAEEYLDQAKTLATCPEIDIANAFIYSQKGEKNTALNILARVDLPLSRSAALIIVNNHDNSQEAVEWFKATGLDIIDLDSDGKYYLMTLNLESSNWETVQSLLETITIDDQNNTPALHHVMAISNLISAVPEELRTIVLKQLPFQASGFPLASNAPAMVARRKACQHFKAAIEAAQNLNLPIASKIDEAYALWLELKDPQESEQGKAKLEAKLRDPKSALHIIPLALQFNINLDLDAVEREIDRYIALHGGMSVEAAMARFALAFANKNPEDIANYIFKHFEELIRFYDKKMLKSLQIEMFSAAGLVEKAKECFKTLVEENLLSSLEESKLQRVIEQSDCNSLEIRIQQFKKTGALVDLVDLVNELEINRDWDGLKEYCKSLFEKTKSVADAERYVRALTNTHKSQEIVKFLKLNSDIMAQSNMLIMSYCWALYLEGALIEARSELLKLGDNNDDTNYRTLHVNLSIALGDWHSLSTFVASEYKNKDNRSATELIRLAHLALNVGSPYARDLLFIAAEKGANDANLLTAAYSLATKADWEDDPKVFNWVKKALELSGEDGPIQKKKLQDLINMKPEWDRHESEIWKLLSNGDLPIFVAAHTLNRSLMHLTLYPALANQIENNPRRKGAIPAYSGKRPTTALKTGMDIAIDVTAFITLSLLGILEMALDAFSSVYIPHSTLKWLFVEKQEIAFHQPSRFRYAHKIQNLLSKGFIEKLDQHSIPDNELSLQVGEDLALLISEAEKANNEHPQQRIVVRPSPVHRIGSLMEEEADLKEHSTVLSSCQAIVDKLRQSGYITVDEESKAKVFLKLQEKPWPDQVEIADGSVLYLDDLAVTHFIHLGILEKLKPAGFKVIISPKEIAETNELISYKDISENIEKVIENIRSSIKSRIESGKIKVSRQLFVDEPTIQGKWWSEHPTSALISFAEDYEAILTDDRFLNQHMNVNNGNIETPIFSTLDLINMLVFTGLITSDNRMKYKTILRRSGYFFIPLIHEDLVNFLSNSMIKDNHVVENAELKAIRENILRIQMSTWLQIPKEAPWLDSLHKTLLSVVKELWLSGKDISHIRACSNWIVGLLDIRGWAHCLSGVSADYLVNDTYGGLIALLLFPPANLSKDILEEFWNWAEEEILVPIRENNPKLYIWLIDCYRKKIAYIANTSLPEDDTND